MNIDDARDVEIVEWLRNNTRLIDVLREFAEAFTPEAGEGLEGDLALAEMKIEQLEAEILKLEAEIERLEQA